MRSLSDRSKFGFLFFVGLAVLTSSNALASVHPLSGNARFQVGDGLPLPIGFSGIPDGKAVAVPGAVVSQPAGADPRSIVFAGDEIQHPPVPFVLVVFAGAAPVFQGFTSVGVSYPHAPGTLAPGKRTGHATVHYCAGDVVTPTGDPACASPGAGTGINGLMIYTATGNQFGGAMSGRLFGSTNQAIYGGGELPPCNGPNCIVAFVSNGQVSMGTGHPGSAFGGSHMSPGGPPSSGFLTVNITANGLIVSGNPTSAMNPGLPNPVTSLGGPWTTGRVTVSVTAALAGAEVFVLTGGDSRASGVGDISLVSGGMSNRGLSGPNANRGWLNLSIGGPIGAVPSLGVPGMVALVAMMGLGFSYVARANRRKGSSST